MRARGLVEPVFVQSLDDLPAALTAVLEEGDLLLTLGAGDIGTAAAGLPQSLVAEVQAG